MWKFIAIIAVLALALWTSVKSNIKKSFALKKAKAKAVAAGVYEHKKARLESEAVHARDEIEGMSDEEILANLNKR